MKKAILNLGLLSMMMMLTSFTNEKVTLNDATTLLSFDQKGGQILPTDSKSLITNYYQKGGQILPKDGKSLITNSATLSNLNNSAVNVQVFPMNNHNF